MSKSTVSTWLRGMPLTASEQSRRQSDNGRRMGGWNKKDRGERSKFSVAAGDKIDNGRKGRIAEAAVLFRLALHGFHVHGSAFDGSRSDWIVENPETGKLSRLQVKWAGDSSGGVPVISLKCFEGHSKQRRLREDECDLVVGYDLHTDTAYVFRLSELSDNVSTVSIRPEAAERWDLVP